MSFARTNNLQQSPKLANRRVNSNYSQLPYILNNPSLSLKSLPTLPNQLSPSNGSTRFTKKMVRVVNGTYRPAADEEQQFQIKRNISMGDFSKNINVPLHTEGAEAKNTYTEGLVEVPQVVQSPIINKSHSTASLQPKPLNGFNVQWREKFPLKDTGEGAICQAAKIQSASEVENNSISLDELQYQHLKGSCVCVQCSCGKHKCVVARNSQRKHPQKSIYTISFVKKDCLPGGNIDHQMYENMKTNTQTIDVDSVAHNDYRHPDVDNYLNPTLSFKPIRKFELNPLQVGRSHYRRDFLEWGCAPYQPIKAYSNRTTIDAMPFTGGTTYTKDFQTKNVARPVLINKNHETTISKSAIPFLGFTTSQEFFKPFKAGERAIKYKASDELITGAPTFLGQFQTLNSKDFRGFPKRSGSKSQLRTSHAVA